MRIAEDVKPIILRMNPGPDPTHDPTSDPTGDPRAAALHVLCLADPGQKALRARELFALLDPARIDVHMVLPEPPALPGRPALPRLVPPKEVPTRSPFTLEGRAALLHAITHIEFNAINLALDAIWRFAHMPPAYYRNWLQVAVE